MPVQQGLFDTMPDSRSESDYLGVPGLRYYSDLLSPEDQTRVLQEVYAHPWQDDLKRRVQHYGYKYDYKSRSIDRSMYVGPLPTFAVDVARLLMDRGLVRQMPDQLIVNEYKPGQGISAHVDCVPCFEDTIVTVSLGAVYTMDFINVETSEVVSAPLELGSALVLQGEARYRWMHRIQARKTDGGRPRGTRVSLTYRKVIVNE